MGLLSIFKRQRKAYHHVFDVNDRNFQLQVLQRSFKTPMMVDFWAHWCGPCRQLMPVLERVAFEQDSPFLLAKLDTDANKRTAGRYGVRSLPTVKFFRNGEVVGAFGGLQFESAVRQFVDKHVNAPPPQPQMGLKSDPRQRLGQARRLLKKGKSFKAAIALRGITDGPEAEVASQLLPLANFMWDVDDGDGMSGKKRIDSLYMDALENFEAGKMSEVRQILATSIKEGDALDKPYTESVIVALDTLMAPTTKG